MRLQLRHLLDRGRELLGVEGRERADAVAAGKRRGLAEIGIFDVGIGQLALAQIQPFQPLVAGRQRPRQGVQALCACVILVPDNGHVGRLDRQLLVREQHARQRPHHLLRSAREIAHRMRGLLAIGLIAEIAIEQVHEARDLDLVVHQLGRLGEDACLCLRFP